MIKRWGALPWLLGALAATGVHGLVVWLFQSRAPLPLCDGLLCDFTLHYLPTFRSVLAGGAPEQRFLYPPFFALLGAPIGHLSDAAAARAWLAVEAVAFAVLAYVPARWLFQGRVASLYLVLLALSDAALNHTVWGQVGIPLAALALSALVLWRHDRPRTAAALLGMAIAIKYYPVVFLLWWVARREWRFVAWTAGWTAAFSLSPVLLLGLDGMARFFGATASGINRMGELSADLILTQGWAPVLGRLSGYTGLGPLFALELWVPLLLALLAGAGWAFLRFAREDQPLLAFSLLFLVYPLISPIAWPHYMVGLPFCQCAGLIGARRSAAPLILSAVLASVVTTAIVGPAPYVAFGLPFLANLTVLATIVLREASPRPTEAVAPALGTLATDGSTGAVTP